MNYNQEVEKAILAMALAEPEMHYEIFTIPGNHFYSGNMRDLYLKLQEMYYDGQSLELANLGGKINMTYAMDIIETYTHTKSQFPAYKNRLEEDFNKRSILNINKKLSWEMSSNEMKTIIDGEINKLDAEDTDSMNSITELIDEYGNEKAYKEMTTSVLNTGFIDLDKILIVKNGDLIVIAGRPAMGKTALSLNIVRNVSKIMPVGFLSLEMRSQYLLKRLASAEGQYIGYEGFEDGCKKLRDRPIYIDDASKYNLPNLGAKIQTMVKKYGVKVIFLDYLTLLDPPEAQNMNLAIAIISRELKHLAKKFNIPIIPISQLSRKVEERKDKRPQLSDLRESGAIEQDADAVLFTYIPWNYGIIEDSSGTHLEKYMEIILGKQRDGAIGTVKIHYNRKSQYMGNWSFL